MAASIVFVPICSNCGEIIYGKVIGGIIKDEINYDYFSEKVMLDSPFERYIKPRKCPECGKQFEKIVFPDYKHLIEDGTGVDMMAYAEEEHSKYEL